MGGSRTTRQEGGEQREQAPITIVPSRRLADERQAAELRTGLERVRGEIRSLQEYAAQVRVPATGRTAADLEAECDRLGRALERMALSSVPVLGRRYRDEIEMIRERVDAARAEARAGNIGNAAALLGNAREMISGTGEIFGLQLAFIMAGEPRDISIPGVAPDEAYGLVLDALELVLRDRGTVNSGRYDAVVAFARIYSDPANAQAYNIDNALVRSERDSLFGQIIQRGREAQAGETYTPEQAQEDRRMRQSFEANIARIRSQLATHNNTVLTQWRDAVTILMAEQRDEGARSRLETLRGEIDSALRRMAQGQALTPEEMRVLANRYYLVTGRMPPLSDDERDRMLRDAAADLRGTARTVRDATAEWYGEQAQQALREGNRELASLAVAMGMLERSARGSAQGARDYLSDYWTIHDSIAQRRPITPGMATTYGSQIALASVLAESDRTLRDFESGGTREKRERIQNAARLVRERLRGGDVEGARRLMDMLGVYTDLLRERRWQAWTGSGEMEAALDQELQGNDATQRFNNAAIHLRFSHETARFREAVSDWGRSMSAQKQAVEQALAHVESLAEQGNSQEAQRVLTLIVMYTDAVERLGVRRGGVVTTFSEESARTVRGMETALTAIRRGVADEGTDGVFMGSFNAAMGAYVEREATAIEALMARREMGRDTITEALRVARQRSARGNYRDAITLLSFVMEFYGPDTSAMPAEPGARVSDRAAGWRYGIFSSRPNATVSGMTTGVQEILDGIRMEMGADSQAAHLAAAQQLDRGTSRIALTDSAMRDFRDIRERFEGRTAFVEGQSDTVGRVPLGERRNGRYQGYVELRDIRYYETLRSGEDPLLRGGLTLGQLFTNMQRAAESGNIGLYNSMRALFNARFQLVAQRASRRVTIDAALTQARDLEQALREVRALYGSSPPAAVTARLDALERRRADLATTLRDARGTTAEFPADDYSRLLVDFDRERRLGVAYSTVSQQIELNDQYYRILGAQSGQLTSFARSQLDLSRPRLVAARDALARGEMNTAMTEYREGIYRRRTALGFFNARNALTLTRSESWATGIREGVEFVGDLISGYSFEEAAQRVGPPTPTHGGAPQYEGYQNMHTDAFHDILFGSGTREDGQRMTRLMNAARMVELSVFTIPADNPSQMLSDFVPDQERMASLARDAVAAARRGDQAEADRLLREGETLWGAMSRRAEDNAWWGNAATIVAALGISLIPGGGWVVGGSIFTTMALDRVVTEISMNGSASTEAWVMLGLTVGTMGLAGAGAIMRSSALAAEAAGASNAARLMTASRALTWTMVGVGVGFSAYAGYEAVQAFQEGRTRDGILMTGMALFPFAHMAGARAWTGLRGGGARRGAPVPELETVLEETQPSARRPAIDIEVTESTRAGRAQELRNPSRLFEFLRDYFVRDAAGRTALLETIPEAMRPAVTRLAEMEVVQTALRSGSVNDVAMAALRRTISTFEGPRPPSGGPRGTRPQWEFSSWLTGEQGMGAFRSFLRDLLVPDGAPAGRLNARDIARGRLEQLRAESPDAARIVDGLLRNPTVSDAIVSGQDTVLSTRMLNEALNGRMGGPRDQTVVRQGIRQMLPEELIAAEREAVALYQNEVAMAVGYEGPLEIAPARGGPAGPGAVLPPRAMAGEPGGPTGGARPPIGGRPPAPVTETPGGARGGGARPSGGPRAPAEVVGAPEDVAAAQAAQGGASRVEVVRIGPLRQFARGIRQRFADSRAQRAEARRGPPVPEEFAREAGRRLDDTLASAVRPDEIPIVVDEAIRGLDAAAQAEISNGVRSAPSRIAETLRALWRRANDRNTPREQRDQAWRAMSRMLSHDNVRAAMDSMVRSGDSELGTIMRQTDAVITRGARTARVSVTNYRNQLARQGMSEDAMFVVETLERQAAEPLARARASIRELETATIPNLERQLAQAQRTADVARGRAQARANARVETLQRQLDQARGQLDAYERMLSDPANAPLTRTQDILGIQLSTAERAPVLLRLQDAGIIPPDAVLLEVISAGRRAGTTLSRISTGNSPVAEAMRASIDRSLNRSSGSLSASLDDTLLASLRSQDVIDAVGRQHGPRVAEMYRNAVREGTLREVLGRIESELPTDVADPLLRFTRTASTALAEDFAMLTTLGDRAASAIGGGTDVAGAFGNDFRPVGARIGDWYSQSYLRGALRALFRRGVGEPGTPQYGEYSIFTQYFWRAGREILRTVPEGMTMARLGGYGRIGMQMAIWGGEAYLLGRGLLNMYRWLTESESLEAGLRICRQNGYNCSEDNARYIVSQLGRDFFTYLPSIFPVGTDRRPGNAADLRAALERPGMLIDPARINEVLDDGRQMTGRLSEINSLLELRRSGSTEDQQRAARDLTAILQPWGMTLEMVDGILSREGKTALDATDLVDMRRDDWLRRGLAVRFRDVVVESFLLDCGVQFRRGEGASRFLTENPDVFVSLWNVLQTGNVPIAYMDDAIASLSREGVLAGIRAQMAEGRTLDALIMENLTAANVYFAEPIRQESFLGRLDSRAAEDPRLRETVEQLLLAYRANDAALRAFNGFTPQASEQIYGDPADLARLIVENPSGALEEARRRGMVGVGTIADMDPSIWKLPAAQRTAIMVFVRDHSEATAGVLRWLNARSTSVGGHVVDILRDLSGTEAAATMTAAQLFNESRPEEIGYLDRQADRYKQRGWWRGDTPSEARAAREAAAQRGPPRPGTAPAQAAPSRADRIREESRPRSPRRPGFEAATPTRTGEPAAAAPATAELSAEQRREADAFFRTEAGQAFDRIIITALAGMYAAPADSAVGRDVRAAFGESTARDRDNNPVPPAAAVQAARGEVFRVLFLSERQMDTRMRGEWGVTITGEGDARRVTVVEETAFAPVSNRIRVFTGNTARARRGESR